MMICDRTQVGANRAACYAVSPPVCDTALRNSGSLGSATRRMTIVRWGWLRVGVLGLALWCFGAAAVWAGGSDCERKAAQRVSHDCVSCEASVVCLEKVNA